MVDAVERQEKLVDIVAGKAEVAFHQYKLVEARKRASFLRAISTGIEQLGDVLIQTAMKESNLPEARLKGERGRTTGQLNAFAKLLEDGDWVQASIDTGDAARTPAPKPDLRKMLFPVGPVVVFGASNFPLAFSTAGGDTASALAAGCSVIVKSHPAHPETSALVAGAIQQALVDTGMPANTFQHIEDGSLAVGQALVQHPKVKAASFTGSYIGGKALFDLANQRQEPIPFFAEMGSVNPVVILPEATKTNTDLPATLAGSITLGVGQFCTNPGLILLLDSPAADVLLKELAARMQQAQPALMLHKGIRAAYAEKRKESLKQAGVTTLAEVIGSEELSIPTVATVSAQDFLRNELLQEEVFGPYSLVVRCKNTDELQQVVQHLKGQLTATVFGTAEELSGYTSLIQSLRERCGRLIFNGVPTGVEVTKSMQHGGPFPSSSDSRFTSVGVDAIYRFVRPVSYQDAPEVLLPAELKNQNELNIIRCVNGKWTRDNV